MVIAAAREHGWIHFGAGPAADSTWLSAMYPGPSGTTEAANALWVSILFDFGEVGVAAFGVLMIVAVWRMRRNPQMTAILLPFFIATLVNSVRRRNRARCPRNHAVHVPVGTWAAPFHPQGKNVSTTKLRFPGGGHLKASALGFPIPGLVQGGSSLRPGLARGVRTPR